jgi:hypothetical protein
MLGRPLHTVVETPQFRRCVRDLLTEEELRALVEHLAAEPDAGDVMPRTGGARKLRWQRRGKGKSGGIRVITFYSGPPVPVFLLSAFGKGRKLNLSRAEQNELRQMLGDLVSEYRNGVRGHVEGR